MKKTNAMRALDLENIHYETLLYDEDIPVDGMKIAQLKGLNPELVFKTLVCKGQKDHYVFQIPVNEVLDLKKAAVISKEKKLELLPLSDLTKITGYVRGGCTPIGMKKQFPTFIHNSISSSDYYYISGGKKGIQIKVNPQSIKVMTKGKFADLTKEKL